MIANKIYFSSKTLITLKVRITNCELVSYNSWKSSMILKLRSWFYNILVIFVKLFMFYFEAFPLLKLVHFSFEIIMYLITI